MNREEAIKILKEHHDHWMRLLKEGICTEEEGENAIEALDMAIKALDQEPCGDAIDRAEAIKIASGYCHPANVAKELAKLPSVNPQPCEEAISRQAVLDLVVTNHRELNGINVVMYSPLCKDIKQLPPVQQESKTGYWIEKDGYDGDTYYDCSECGESWTTIEGTPWDNEFKYCPSCGARMVEPQERSDKE